jgi:hypothetical protein
VDCNNGAEDTYDGWLLLLNTSGGIEWVESLGGTGDDQFYSIKKNAHDGSYIVVGEFDTQGANDQDAWIIKLELNDCPVTKMASQLNPNSESLISITPNPADEYLIINFISPGVWEEKVTIEMRNQLGKTVYITEANIQDGVLNHPVSMLNLSAGFYLITLYQNEQVFDSKIIVQHQ